MMMQHKVWTIIGSWRWAVFFFFKRDYNRCNDLTRHLRRYSLNLTSTQTILNFPSIKWTSTEKKNHQLNVRTGEFDWNRTQSSSLNEAHYYQSASISTLTNDRFIRVSFASTEQTPSSLVATSTFYFVQFYPQRMIIQLKSSLRRNRSECDKYEIFIPHTLKLNSKQYLPNTLVQRAWCTFDSVM